MLGGVFESLEPRRLMSTNYIIAENQLPGTPQSTWDVPTQDTSIMGFATDISVDQGQTVYFKIDDKNKAAYHIDIYRMGYYQGNGARKVATIASSNTLKTAQPSPLTDSKTGLVDAGNWSVTASWAVPGTAVSGIYFGRVVREDTGGASLMYFVVRDDDGQSDVLFQTSDTTWQAYNDWGGNSLYVGSSQLNPVGSAYPRAVKVSYNRPLSLRDTFGGMGSYNDPMHAEYPMVRFLEQNGYNVSYFTGVDTDRRGSELLEHKTFLSVGHDEYWSGNQRKNVEAARDAGVNLAFFSGNEMYWKGRYENATDSSGTPYRTLVCYKETHAQAKADPLNGVWTGQWRDPRFGPHDGGKPENALTGQMFAVNRDSVDLGTAIQVPSEFSAMRLWRNTTIATMSSGTTATLSAYTLGYEWDEDVDNGMRPAGMFNLSRTTHNVPEKLLDTYSGYGAPCPNCGGIASAGCGCVVGADTATHTLTEYRAPSGALVFGAGTVQWSWGLDSTHIDGSSTVDKRMQQATVNLLADMGAQPGTLMSGLSSAAQSSDTSAPVALISTSLAGISLVAGKSYTISGTATDSGGGVVAAVEVSTDGGNTWHPASGRGSWSYSWVPTQGGVANIRARAVDDSGNLQTNPASINTPAVSGPSGQTILGDATPTDANDLDVDAQKGIELGVKFTTEVSGYITGIRFYKSTFNTGTHVGNLWTSSGTKLASVTFTNEGTEGWQSAAFSTPILVQANTTYVASYFTPKGHYASDEGYFLSRVAGKQQVHNVAETATVGNGLYHYGTTGGFPTDSWQASNFYVDVFFQPAVQDNTPPTVTANTPAAGATNVSQSTALSATFSESINPANLSFVVKDASNNTVAGTVTYNDTTKLATFTPSSQLNPSTTYTATVTATDLAGNPMTAAKVWSFQTMADTVAPTVISVSPSNGITGVAPNAVITVTFSEALLAGSVDGTTVSLKTSGGSAVAASITYNTATKSIIITPSASLGYSTGYVVTVVGGASGVKDLANNALVSTFTSTFTTGAQTQNWQQTTAGQFGSGVASNVDITNTAGGELTLGMLVSDDFTSASLGSGWTVNNWDGTGSISTSISAGVLTLGRTQIRSTATTTDSPFEARISVGAGAWQEFGLGTDLAEETGNYWAIFSTLSTTNTLYAQVNNNNSVTKTSLGTLPSGYHVYKIVPTGSGFQFYIDGTLKTTINKALPAGVDLPAVVSNYNGSPAILVDYVHLTDYAPSGTFVSQVFDAGSNATWGAVNWSANVPSGASLLVEISVGNSATPDGTWSAFTAVANGGSVNLSGRYVRYRITLVSADGSATGTLNDIALSYIA
jgi:hypothetical protein